MSTLYLTLSSFDDLHGPMMPVALYTIYFSMSIFLFWIIQRSQIGSQTIEMVVCRRWYKLNFGGEGGGRYAVTKLFS
jgi:hypothetical protein